MSECQNEQFICHDSDSDDGNRQVYDIPSQFVGLKLTKNRSVDLVSHCSVFLYLYGLEKALYALSSTRYGAFFRRGILADLKQLSSEPSFYSSALCPGTRYPRNFRFCPMGAPEEVSE
eukprot:IDg11097t1